MLELWWKNPDPGLQKHAGVRAGVGVGVHFRAGVFSRNCRGRAGVGVGVVFRTRGSGRGRGFMKASQNGYEHSSLLWMVQILVFCNHIELSHLYCHTWITRFSSIELDNHHMSYIMYVVGKLETQEIQKQQVQGVQK